MLAFCKVLWYNALVKANLVSLFIDNFTLIGVLIMVIAIVIIDLLVCLALVGVVMIQSGKTSGLSGAFGGNSDTFLSKNKAKSFDAKLSRSTKWVAVAFIVLTLVLNIIT